MRKTANETQDQPQNGANDFDNYDFQNATKKDIDTTSAINYKNQKNSSAAMLVSNDTIVCPKDKDRQLWRDLVAYWILGLTNNYGYVIMLSAAHDIIAQFSHKGNDDVSTDTENSRMCHIQSTGTILLADILPALVMKFSAPFLPFWVNVRAILAITLSVSGFLCVALADSEALALLGVIFTSASSGLGETTFLSYSSRFNKNVISTWSSGTGGAGIFGSLSYAALKSAGIDHQTTILIMLFVPAIECIAFWVILRRPADIILPTTVVEISTEETLDKQIDQKTVVALPPNSIDEKPLVGLKQKLKYCLTLIKYILPLTLVYFAEYFINQGLFELVNYEGIFLDKPSQYRWLAVDYQIGVFVSRSTVNLYSVNRIWLLSVFQFINVIYFLAEVIFYVTPSIWITFAIVFWEGLLGGGAYVNTFYKLSKEISPARKQFAISFVAIADSIGISTAGFVAIPVHNAICKTSAPFRYLW